MNVGANGKLLLAATRALSVKWSETREGWSDAKAEEFEKRFMTELWATIDRAVPVFDDLDKIVTRVRIDCE